MSNLQMVRHKPMSVEKNNLTSLISAIVLHMFTEPALSTSEMPSVLVQLSGIMRKTDFCLCDNKGTGQLRSNCEASAPLFSLLG